MLLRYKYRSSFSGTSDWYVTEQEDLMRIFKYDTVMWMMVQRLDTGDVRYWNGKKWSRPHWLVEQYVRYHDK